MHHILMRRKSNTKGAEKVSNEDKIEMSNKTAKTFVGNNKIFIPPRSKIKKVPTEKSFGNIAQITSLKSQDLKGRTVFKKIPKVTIENALLGSKNNTMLPKSKSTYKQPADVTPGKFKD